MNSARMDGKTAWCSRASCRYPRSLAVLQFASDGSLYARLTGRRWRRDGSIEGTPRYVMVQRRRQYTRVRDDGAVEKRSGPEYRVPCPIALVCSCDWVQAIGIDPPP